MYFLKCANGHRRMMESTRPIEKILSNFLTKDQSSNNFIFSMLRVTRAFLIFYEFYCTDIELIIPKYREHINNLIKKRMLCFPIILIQFSTKEKPEVRYFFERKLKSNSDDEIQENQQSRVSNFPENWSTSNFRESLIRNK